MTSTDTLEPTAMGETLPAAAARTRPGQIVLARHGEPALSRKCRLTSRQYRDWWARYELGGLRAGQSPPGHVQEAARKAGVILTSTRKRSIETAKAVAADREMTHDALFIEAPLPPPAFPDFVRLSPRAWGVVSRFWWWFFGHHEGQETRREAQARAAKAAELLDELAGQGQDVLLVAHGFFNTMIGLELRRKGWRCVCDRGFKYWSTRHFERSRT
jgi:broad specificity phosphatase PhoE